jgi:hypothetical protein
MLKVEQSGFNKVVFVVQRICEASWIWCETLDESSSAYHQNQ